MSERDEIIEQATEFLATLDPETEEEFRAWVWPAIAKDMADFAITIRDEALAARNKEIEAKVALFTAHRAVGNQEQDLANGKLAGYCLVCQVPWPCEYAISSGVFTAKEIKAVLDAVEKVPNDIHYSSLATQGYREAIAAIRERLGGKG